MSEYFSNFPKILYDIDGTNSTAPEFSTAVNLLIRNKLREVVKGDISIYYPYVIPEEVRRPDVLSQNVYGDVSFTWTIFLVNNILDPLWQWPMDSRVFESYLTRKYGSVGASKITVHHYEYIHLYKHDLLIHKYQTTNPLNENNIRFRLLVSLSAT